MLIPKVSISLTFKLIIESYEPQQTHRIKKKGDKHPQKASDIHNNQTIKFNVSENPSIEILCTRV